MSEGAGWICLFRQLKNKPLWCRERFTPGQAWVDLLLSAAHKRHTVQLKRSSRVVVVDRGQILTSQASLAARWKWDRKTVRGFLQGLETSQSLLIHNTQSGPNGYTLLSVTNWEAYQGGPEDLPHSDSQSSPQSHSPNRPQDQQGKQSAKRTQAKEKLLAGKPDAASPPPDALAPKPLVYWDPNPTWRRDHPSLVDAQIRVNPALLQQLESDFPRIDVRRELVRMKHHALKNPAWARTKRDWKRTFGNWLQIADERLDDARFKAGANGQPKTFGQLKDQATESRIRDARNRDALERNQRKEIEPSPPTKALPKPWES